MKRWLRAHGILACILLLSAGLNCFYLHWGLPAHWHPDEKTRMSLVMKMFEQGTMNPHHFVNPSFNLYLIMAAVLPYAGIVKAMGLAVDPSVMYLIGRLVSAVMGAATVWMVYRITMLVADRASAYFSALFLALTMGFVNLTHFATSDITAVFLCTLTIFLSVRIVQKKRLRDYCYAGAAAGLALSTKYTAAVLIAPLVAAFLIDEGASLGNGAVTKRRRMIFVLEVICASAAIALLVGAPAIARHLSPDGLIEKKTALFLTALQAKGMAAAAGLVVLLVFVWLRKKAGEAVIALCTHAKLRYALLAMAAVFFIATPYALLDARTFTDGIFNDWLLSVGMYDFGTLQTVPSWGPYMRALYAIMGWPLFLLSAAGFLYGMRLAFYKERRAFCILLVWLGFFYALLGAHYDVASRYIMPIVPAAAVCAGILAGRYRVIAVFVLLYSCGYTLTLESMFANDSRARAGLWIAAHIPPRAPIATYSREDAYLPAIPAGFSVREGKEEEGDVRPGEYCVLTSANFARYFWDTGTDPARSAFYRTIFTSPLQYHLVARFGYDSIFHVEADGVDQTIVILRKG